MKPLPLILALAALCVVSCKSATPYAPQNPVVTNANSIAWTLPADTNVIGCHLYRTLANSNPSVWTLVGDYPAPQNIAAGILTNDAVGVAYSYTIASYTKDKVESLTNPMLTNTILAPLPVPSGVVSLQAK